MACSSVTTLIPSRGLINASPSQSERTRQAENMLGHVRQNQVRRNWRNLIQTRFAEFAFHVVFTCKAEAAMELQTGVGRLPRGIGGQQLRHVRLRTTRFMCVEAARRFETHQARGFA